MVWVLHTSDAWAARAKVSRSKKTQQAHLEFHIWFLKEKKLVERTERGFAITALGVEEAEQARSLLTRERLLPEQAGADRGPEPAPSRRHLSAVAPKRVARSES